ncbi:MAG: hypothetical protein PWQ20_1204 [Thermotogaceae bacterium]|nr:hypothetical protein [Thermotogaceae bacterium]
MSVLKKFLIVLLIFVLFLSTGVFSWNKTIYTHVMNIVLASLPEELSTVFSNQEVKQMINEFLAWNDDFGSKDHLKNPIHFFSTESYGNSPEAIKENLSAYLSGKKSFDDDKGMLLPVVMRYAKATLDLAQTNQNSFPRMLGLLVHFLTDLNSPLHVTKYVDGKTKSQSGVHFVWEDITSKKLSELNISPVVPEEIEDLEGYILNALVKSWQLSEKFFEIENEVSSQSGGRKSGNYSELLFERTKDIVQSQLQNAVKMISDIIYTAYERAKNPDLPAYNISIIKIYHWSDDRYVIIKNLGKSGWNLKNWRLYSYYSTSGTASNYYEFLKTILSPDEEIRIHSGPRASRSNRAKTIFWSLKRIWGDHAEALLMDDNKNIVDLYVY